MEFFNNIWTALTTENEKLIAISSVPILFLIETPLSMFLFLYALNIEANKKQKLFYVVTMALIYTISQLIIPSPYNVIFNYILMFLIVLKAFKLGYLKTFVAIIIPIFIFALLNVLLMNPYLSLMKITREQIIIIPIYRYLYLFFLYITVTIIVILLKHKKYALIILDEFDNKNKIIIISNLLLGLLTIIIQLIICYYYLNSFPVIVTLLSAISLLAYFSISIYSLTRITKLVLTTQKLQNAEAYNKSLSALYDNIRGFKHDFDNIVSAIGGYVETKDMNGLTQYYYQLEKDCQRVNTIAALNPNLINNPAIYNLLNDKYNKASKLQIEINLEVFLDLNSLHMKIYEFCRMLGILLDNSIEAAKECDEKVIHICFRNEYNRNRQVVIIENTYNNKNLDIDKIFEKGISGKKNHTGIGLWEVRQILSKNDNLNLHTTKDEKFFKQQLEIYY